MVRRRGQSGYALMTALLVLLLVSISLALLAASLNLRMRLLKQEAETVHLAALTDGVLAETLANLYVQPDFAGVPEHPLGRGKVKSQVTSVGLGRYTVVATTKYAGKERSARAEVARTESKKLDALGRPRLVVRVTVTSWQRVAGSGGASSRL
ncbi:MAG TPA: hypothetical protein VLQ45_18425 [Thermoanaerobaculia bacterium]|nr:hypothetical protein [Thermoanaerobaculia bacterium]